MYWLLTEFWPNSDVRSSNGSIPRRSNLSTQVRTAEEDLGAAAAERYEDMDRAVKGAEEKTKDFGRDVGVLEATLQSKKQEARAELKKAEQKSKASVGLQIRRKSNSFLAKC